jgi:DNA-binding response OmpR family regulator
MDQVLLVEDNHLFASILSKRIEEELNFTVQLASSYSQAVKFIEEDKNDFFLSLLDLNLPDAPNKKFS